MKKTILIVDQSPIFLSLYEFMIPKDEFVVLKTDDGRVALHLLEKTKVDLIISDMDKPYGSGLMLLENVIEKNLKIPVIIVSGNYHPYSSLVDRYAYKFIPKVELLQKLGEILKDGSDVWAVEV